MNSEAINARLTEEALQTIKTAEAGVDDPETRWEIIQDLEELLRRYKTRTPFQQPDF